MKKLFPVSIAILLLVALIFSGCAKEAPAPAPAPTPTPAPTPSPAPTPAPEPVKPIVLNWAMSSSPMNLATKMVIEPWISEVEKRTNGRVTMKPYYSEALGRSSEYFDMLEADAVNIASFTMHILPGRFPLVDFFELPFLFPDYPTYDKEGNRIEDVVFEKYIIPLTIPEDMKMIDYTKTAFCVIQSAEKPVRKLEDMKGMLMGNPGGKVLGPLMKKYDASLEIVLPPDMYTAMEKKMIDAEWMPVETNLNMKLYEVTKYITMINTGGGGVVDVISPGTWASLSPDIQKVFDDLIPTVNKWRYDCYIEGNREAIENAKKVGIEIIEISPEERARWVAAADGVSDAWIDEMEAQGWPMRAMYDDITQRIAEAEK